MKNQSLLHELPPQTDFRIGKKKYRTVSPARRSVPLPQTTCQVMNLKTNKVEAMKAKTIVNLSI
jgi:hypothetical protein